MTNEEKAREIALDNCFDLNDRVTISNIELGAEKMGEWKDEQFKKHLQDKIDKLCELGCNTDSQELTKTYADRMVVLAEVMYEIMEGKMK